MLAFLNDPSISIFLATISPTVALIAVNMELFSKTQMRNSLIVISVVGGILAAMFHVANSYWLFPWISNVVENPIIVIELISCMVSLGLFFSLSERLFSELIRDRKTRLYTKSAIVACFALLTFFLSIAALNIIFALYTVVSSYDLWKSSQESKATSPASSGKEIAESSQVTEFKHKPNVYVLFLESFHSGDALDKVYGIDNGELCSYLKQRNFTLYENMYSNSYMTELAFSNLMWPEMLHNPLHFRDYSPVPSSKIVSAFAQNGYRLNLFSSDYLKSRFSDLFHYCDSGLSNVGSSMNRLFAPILSQSAKLRSLFSAADIFENDTDFPSLLSGLRTKIEDQKDVPQFHWFHFGAHHSPQSPWDELEFFEDVYAGYYRKAEEQLQETIDMIMEHDSNPLIISVGDHGACRFRYIADGVGDDPNEIIRSRGYEPELIARDFFGVFLGIHWPVGHFTEGEVLSHVRVFNHVLAALSEDKAHLENMMPNDSIFRSAHLLSPYTVAQDGIALKDWEPVTQENEMEHILDEIEKSPDNVQNHLALVEKCFKVKQEKRGMDYLLALVLQFPKSEEVRVTLSQIYVDRKDYGNAKKHALIAIDINPSCGMAYYWLAMVAEGEGQTARCESFITKAYECGCNLAVKKDLHLRYAYVLIRQDKHEEAFEVINQVNKHDRIAFTEIIDWQMQYASFRRGSNPELISWLDDSLIGMEARQKIVRTHDRKLILSMLTEDWEEAESSARKLIDLNDNHIGAYVALGRSLEAQGKIGEALQFYAQALSSTRNQILLEQLGFMAIRHNIQHPDLEPIKATAREHTKARLKDWGKLTSFDEKWYAEVYGHMLGGQSPLEHYMQNSVALMLNPNRDFDTAYYYTNHTDVFTIGIDAALHYSQYGQHELFRPRPTCLYDHSITPNIEWKSASPQ